MAKRDEHEHEHNHEHDNGEDDPVMRELTAHLDRGWTLLEHGDLDGARAATAAATAIHADSAEAATLEGAIAEAGGDVDAALEAFDRAIELDPDAVDPYLHAAELHAYALGEFEDAIELCDAALEVAEEEEDYLDALLLKAECQIELDDQDAAKVTLQSLPPARLPEAQLEYRAGGCLMEVGDFETAEGRLRAALEMEPELTDALHTLGVLHERRGEHQKMAQVFLQVRERDLAVQDGPPPLWHVTTAHFEELAQQALAALPEQLRRHLANVPVMTADYPALELVAEGSDPRMLGFFSGVPYPDKGAMGGAGHLDCVFLYQRNIERGCRTVAEVEDEIRTTLIHEIGHFFGLSEEELEAMGLG